MKFLIAGLGNAEDEYLQTRHNIGFLVADALAASGKAVFSPGRHAHVAELKVRGKKTVVIKPTTYMNLSGKAVQYWLQAEKVGLDHLKSLPDRRGEAAQDLMWALLNSKDFLLLH